MCTYNTCLFNKYVFHNTLLNKFLISVSEHLDDKFMLFIEIYRLVGSCVVIKSPQL